MFFQTYDSSGNELIERSSRVNWKLWNKNPDFGWKMKYLKWKDPLGRDSSYFDLIWHYKPKLRGSLTVLSKCQVNKKTLIEIFLDFLPSRGSLYLDINSFCSSGNLKVSGWNPNISLPNLVCILWKFFHNKSFLLRSIKPGNLLIFTPCFSLLKSMASIVFSTRGKLSQMNPFIIISFSSSHLRMPWVQQR